MDTLLKRCIAHETLSHRQKPVTEAIMSTVPPVQCWNFSVWISVCVETETPECAALHHHMLTQTKEEICPPISSRKQEVADSEMGWGRDFCKGREEPAVPLPATELGDSALVTTQTVQLVNIYTVNYET
ncbi:hypothetical protein Baya_16475 [Bagarius yarrelli]|uniref:Uncharacterized protein n=1 Tax=Bagarius yarrelli TaxID=175774 RepID=A0A556VVZ5_BAGYA|nr:hypothetical protein Baya_16475 [Bagarius yarrelli]